MYISSILPRWSLQLGFLDSGRVGSAHAVNLHRMLLDNMTHVTTLPMHAVGLGKILRAFSVGCPTIFEYGEFGYSERVGTACGQQDASNPNCREITRGLLIASIPAETYQAIEAVYILLPRAQTLQMPLLQPLQATQNLCHGRFVVQQHAMKVHGIGRVCHAGIEATQL